MSREYAEKFGDQEVSREQMRAWCQRPGKKNEDGTPLYFTEQAHKDTCDVNKIIKKYDKKGVITHVSKMEAKFGDMTGVEFKAAQDKIIEAKAMFDGLPSEIRNRFNNQPHELLNFMDDERNRDEAISLGIISGRWTPETDGIGEHITNDSQRENIPSDLKKDETKE